MTHPGGPFVERVRIALAAIRDGKIPARKALEEGLRQAPEIFIPGVAYFVQQALRGEVIDPEDLNPD
jgi:hypothetical protein